MKWPIFRFERFKNNIAKLIKIKIANKFNILLLNLHLINERSCIFCEKLQIIASLIQLAYLLTGFSIRITVSFLPLFKKTHTRFSYYPRNQVSLLSYNNSCIAIHLSGATCALMEVSRLASISGIIPYSKRFSSFHDYWYFIVIFHGW